MTLSPTSWSDLSTFTSTRRSLRRQPVGWAARYLIRCQPTGRIVYRFSSSVTLGARQLSWGLRLPIRLLAYYVLPTLHVMCDIKVFHAVQIKVLILGGTSGALISISIAVIQC